MTASAKRQVVVVERISDAIELLDDKSRDSVHGLLQSWRRSGVGDDDSFSTITGALDNRMRMARVSGLGLVVFRSDEEPCDVFLWVASSAEAADWGRRHVCCRSVCDGEWEAILASPDGEWTSAKTPGTEHSFAACSADDLAELGVPPTLVPRVQAISSVEELIANRDRFFAATYEALNWVRNASFSDALAEYRSRGQFAAIPPSRPEAVAEPASEVIAEPASGAAVESASGGAPAATAEVASTAIAESVSSGEPAAASEVDAEPASAVIPVDALEACLTSPSVSPAPRRAGARQAGRRSKVDATKNAGAVAAQEHSDAVETEEEEALWAQLTSLQPSCEVAGGLPGVYTEDKALESVLNGSMDKWRIFLHPNQKAIVCRDYSGPARIMGGAGTGKTVVAVHRAYNLAKKLVSQGEIAKNEKVLFTTFSTNLASDISDKLRQICSDEVYARIDVVNLDSWVARFRSAHGYGSRIFFGADVARVWAEAKNRAGAIAGLPDGFYEEEWKRVVATQGAFSLQAYLSVARSGRRTRLNRRMRQAVWNVFAEYMKVLQEMNGCDNYMAMHQCEREVQCAAPRGMYRHVIVDEGQDFSAVAYRLIRVLAGPEQSDDIFIVGDTHQRIYPQKVVLGSCGVNIRGRSSYLRINYRTTEETRRYAMALLKGVSFDNLDGGDAEDIRCQSLSHGERPSVRRFDSDSEEKAYVMESIAAMLRKGVEARSICVTVRTKALVNDYVEALTNAGITACQVDTGSSARMPGQAVRVATMHRVKGLEFAYVFAACVNDGVVPPVRKNQGAEDPDVAQDREFLTVEKCLLYVALTRAQKQAFISGYGTLSQLLTE